MKDFGREVTMTGDTEIAMKLAAMTAEEIRANFSALMSEIVTMYGDDQEVIEQLEEESCDE